MERGAARGVLLSGLFLALALVIVYVAGWFFLPSDASPEFSPWQRIAGETPSAKVDAYVRAVARGDEAAALDLWELPAVDLPNGRSTALRQRRVDVTRGLIAAGIRPDAAIRSIEWWRTCCEPGLIDGPRSAGGARLQVRLVDRSGTALDYVIDVFDRDGGSSGLRALLTRHWVVRDVYPSDQPPLFWTWGHG